MKKVILAAIIVVSASFLSAQNYNPYVAQCMISQLLPWQLNGTGMASFILGNAGNNPLPLIRNQEMRLQVALSDGLPNVDPLDLTTALTTIGGTWANMFNWSYNVMTNSYTAVQNQAIPGQSSGTITIQYKVSMNSGQSEPANGLNVNITPPPYTNGNNKTADDAANAYTFAQASDYGDAPASYGTAGHVIDLDNRANTVCLGTKVDYESSGLASATANSDDLNGVDDEDGVTFPALVNGTEVTIPVVVTITGNGYGFINAWIDWNGNGDFNDEGEQIASKVPVLASGTINLSVTVPMNAIASAPTYVRFRIGPDNMLSTGSYAFGEVEDYEVQIFNPYIVIDEKTETQQLIIYSYENNIYVKDLTGRELKGKMLVYNLVGQRVAKKVLTGGILNKFSMDVEEGYYVVELVGDTKTVHGKVFLTR